MTTIDGDNWDDLRTFVGKIAAESTSEDWRFAFRGLSNASWAIEATLDRSRLFKTTSERSHYENRLLTLFRREALAYAVPGSDVPDGNALALLARHHGLPSSWTDWTTSPYVAAYFAFASAKEDGNRIAVWVLDRYKLPSTFAAVDLIDEPMLLRLNTRTIRQRGIFIRVPDANSNLSVLLDGALQKFTLPARLAKLALTDLSYMTINASTLFDDLDGAARAANDRILHGF